MSAWFWAMCACYVVALLLMGAGLHRVKGPHWRTSGRWMAAGWCAMVVGWVFLLGGAL